MARAQSLALERVKGTVESKEMEKEKGIWIYSFDLRSADNRIHEVQIDARTGAVVSEEIESPSHEAAEKKGEKN